MADTRNQVAALTIGQVASRWNVGPERVRALVMSGRLPGAFRIPSAGRYGATVKIPLVNVLEVERAWAIAAADRRSDSARPRRAGETRVSLKHLPQLNDEFPPDAGCPATAPS